MFGLRSLYRNLILRPSLLVQGYTEDILNYYGIFSWEYCDSRFEFEGLQHYTHALRSPKYGLMGHTLTLVYYKHMSRPMEQYQLHGKGKILSREEFIEALAQFCS